MSDKRELLLKIYDLLLACYGHRNWWPGETAFEVCVGAILTQNTNWNNVEKAIINLKNHSLLDPEALFRTQVKKIASLIKPAGYYNLKAKRLKSFLDYLFLVYAGDIGIMRQTPVRILRKELLAVNGIGPETADSIMLYALGKAVFVVDAYTRRIGCCLKFISEDYSYYDVQDVFTSNLPKRVKLFNEYHALIVEHGKNTCKKKTRCEDCVLAGLRV
ncbi:MAG: hypothetical protein ABIB11_02030 [Candidatus Omnitrophota bacterium]